MSNVVVRTWESSVGFGFGEGFGKDGIMWHPM